MSDKKKILVVDDEPDVVRWLTLLFQNNGYDTVEAVNGREGFDKAVAEMPDLIFLDESANTSAIPVVMLTGVSREFERFIKTRKQVNPPAAYFEKPVDDKELLAKVTELIG